MTRDDIGWWQAEVGRLTAMAKRDEDRMWEQTSRAHRAEILLDVAIGMLRHNRDRLGKPRGGDEARLLDMLDTFTTGPAAGGTDGWVSAGQLELFGRDQR